jgi:hypothetical protein
MFNFYSTHNMIVLLLGAPIATECNVDKNDLSLGLQNLQLHISRWMGF